MKLTKENREKIDAYFDSKTPEELEYIFEKYKPKRRKKVVEEIVEEGWVDFSKEKPSKEGYYNTRVKDGKKVQEIVDWWSNGWFSYNHDLITYWRRKDEE